MRLTKNDRLQFYANDQREAGLWGATKDPRPPMEWDNWFGGAQRAYFNMRRGSCGPKIVSGGDDGPAQASTIYCSAEWHFASFKSRWAPLIYSLGLRLTHESKTFRVSIPTMARYFGIHVNTARKGVHELRDNLWLDETFAPLGKAVEYRIVEHKEWAEARQAWAAKHPELLHVSKGWKCCEKLIISVGDPLGKRLHGVTGLPYFTNYLKSLRRHGASDDQIVDYCKALWAEERRKDVKTRGFYRRLDKHIAENVVHP